VPAVSGTNLDDYRELVERRLSNPRIADTIPRLCFDGSNRQPKFILPTGRDCLKAGRLLAGLALVSALWARYCEGTTSGRAERPQLGSPAQLSAGCHNRSRRVALHVRHLGGLGTDPAFVGPFSTALSSLWSLGTRATLQAYVHSDGA
jgi:mannitol 2-dehydrogenase